MTRYSFPEYDRTIEADSLEEATAKLKQELEPAPKKKRTTSPS